MQVTFPPVADPSWVQVKPESAFTDRNFVPAGSVSTTLMPEASCVPTSATMIVYVSVPFVAIGSNPSFAAPSGGALPGGSSTGAR